MLPDHQPQERRQRQRRAPDRIRGEPVAGRCSRAGRGRARGGKGAVHRGQDGRIRRVGDMFILTLAFARNSTLLSTVPKRPAGQISSRTLTAHSPSPGTTPLRAALPSPRPNRADGSPPSCGSSPSCSSSTSSSGQCTTTSSTARGGGISSRTGTFGGNCRCCSRSSAVTSSPAATRAGADTLVWDDRKTCMATLMRRGRRRQPNPGGSSASRPIRSPVAARRSRPRRTRTVCRRCRRARLCARPGCGPMRVC